MDLFTQELASGVSQHHGGWACAFVVQGAALSSAEEKSGRSAACGVRRPGPVIAGRVVAVLPSGNLVVEAERSIVMNNERQTVVVRGVVRPGDVSADNTVVSNTLGNLELEIKGKGVISDGTRPPHAILRAILRILNF